MVRTQSQVSSRSTGIDSSRVMAMSTAVALHLLAGGLLLIPLSYRAVPQPPAPKERWVMPVTIATPPPPVIKVKREFTPKVPHTPPTTVPVPVQTPVISQPAVVEDAAVALPAVTDAVTDSAPAIAAPSGPVEAGQLHYPVPRRRPVTRWRPCVPGSRARYCCACWSAPMAARPR